MPDIDTIIFLVVAATELTFLLSLTREDFAEAAQDHEDDRPSFW